MTSPFSVGASRTTWHPRTGIGTKAEAQDRPWWLSAPTQGGIRAKEDPRGRPSTASGWGSSCNRHRLQPQWGKRGNRNSPGILRTSLSLSLPLYFGVVSKVNHLLFPIAVVTAQRCLDFLFLDYTALQRTLAASCHPVGLTSTLHGGGHPAPERGGCNSPLQDSALALHQTFQMM